MKFLFLHYLFVWPPLAYLILMVGMVFEGEGVLFAASLMAHQGALSVYGVWAVSLGAVILGDLGWYWWGRTFGRGATPVGRAATGLIRPFEGLVRRQPILAIAVSKFIYGIHHALLMRLGNGLLRFRSYAPAIVVIDAIWVTFIVGLSFFFTASLEALQISLRYVELAALVGVVGLIGINYLFRRWAEKRLLLEE